MPSRPRVKIRFQRRMVGVAAPLLAVLLVAALPSSTFAWTSASRALAVKKAPAHSMVVDGFGVTHIAVEGTTTKGIIYISGNPGSWTHERITTAGDHEPSIAIDGIGNVHIAFARTDAVGQGIWVVSNETGYWVESKVSSGADRRPSIAMKDLTTHLAFVRTGGKLRYATNGTGSWVSKDIETGCCSGAPSLRLTSGGSPRIAYSKVLNGMPKVLRFASKGSTWTLKTVDTGATMYPSLVLDETNTPHIAYVRVGSGTWYMTRDGSGPFHGRLIEAGYFQRPDLSVAFNSLAFVYGNSHELRYTTSSGGIYLGATLTSNRHDSDPLIERRPNGSVVVVFARTPGTASDGIYFTAQ